MSRHVYFLGFTLAFLAAGCSSSDPHSDEPTSFPSAIPAELSMTPATGRQLSDSEKQAFKNLSKGSDLRDSPKLIVPMMNETSAQKDARETALMQSAENVRDFAAVLQEKCVPQLGTDASTGAFRNVGDTIERNGSIGLVGADCPVIWERSFSESKTWKARLNPGTLNAVDVVNVHRVTDEKHTVQDRNLFDQITLVSTSAHIETTGRVEYSGTQEQNYLLSSNTRNYLTSDGVEIVQHVRSEHLSKYGNSYERTENHFSYRGTPYVVTTVTKKTGDQSETHSYLNGEELSR